MGFNPLNSNQDSKSVFSVTSPSFWEQTLDWVQNLSTLLLGSRIPGIFACSVQKISLFPKFGGCGSKIEPATPISISNFSRAWQSFKVSYALQILVNDRFFIGHQMIFSSNFYICNRKAEIWEKLSFPP